MEAAIFNTLKFLCEFNASFCVFTWLFLLLRNTRILHWFFFAKKCNSSHFLGMHIQVAKATSDMDYNDNQAPWLIHRCPLVTLSLFSSAVCLCGSSMLCPEPVFSASTTKPHSYFTWAGRYCAGGKAEGRILNTPMLPINLQLQDQGCPPWGHGTRAELVQSDRGKAGRRLCRWKRSSGRAAKGWQR